MTPATDQPRFTLKGVATLEEARLRVEALERGFRELLDWCDLAEENQYGSINTDLVRQVTDRLEVK